MRGARSGHGVTAHFLDRLGNWPPAGVTGPRLTGRRGQRVRSRKRRKCAREGMELRGFRLHDSLSSSRQASIMQLLHPLNWGYLTFARRPRLDIAGSTYRIG